MFIFFKKDINFPTQHLKKQSLKFVHEIFMYDVKKLRYLKKNLFLVVKEKTIYHSKTEKKNHEFAF